MSLDFVAIAPHPPIIVPEVGGEDSKKCKKTIAAMEKLSYEIGQVKPDTVIIISPHALIHQDRFAVYGSPEFYGDFGQFGASKISFHYDNDLGLAGKIVNESNQNNIQAYLFGDPDSKYGELDHGEMVPLYYLAKNLPQETKILPIAFSYLSPVSHFTFGQIIKDVANSPEFKDQSIALVASGDLSHRLLQTSPAGFSASGKEFDDTLVDMIKTNQVENILKLDENFIEEAGECGYRSILIALGALDNSSYTPEILSYEGPFGVGYLVVNFKLK
ncbi:MAG: MEMO1 family protein [Patescibacteria group bacterium]|nr:MEMO1 family protein [Patescibacteria group bacterium]